MLAKHEIERLEGLKPEQVPFVYMPCGCIGIKLHDDYYLSIWNCDSDFDHPSIDIRIRQHNALTDYPKEYFDDERRKFKPFEPIPKERFIELIGRLQFLVADGHDWTRLRMLLRIPSKEDL